MTTDGTPSQRREDPTEDSLELRVDLRDWTRQIEHALADIEHWLRSQQHRSDQRQQRHRGGQ